VFEWLGKRKIVKNESLKEKMLLPEEELLSSMSKKADM